MIKIAEKRNTLIFILFALTLLYSYFLMEDGQTLLYLFLLIFLAYSFVSLMVSRKYGAEIKGWLTVMKEKDYTSFALAIPQTGLMGAAVITLYTGIYSIILLSIGFILMLSGMGFNLMVRKDLGKNWVPLSKTTDKQELVTTGIYSKVRHPFYLSIFLMFSGVAIISWNWYGLLFFVLFILGLVIRIKKEEKELITKFGDEYRDYMQKTPRLIPKIL